MLSMILGYNINVILRIPRSSGEELFFDKAKRMKEKRTGKEYFQLRKSKAKAPSVAFTRVSKTNNGYYVELYNPAPGEYYPCEQAENGSVKPMDIEQKNFYAEQVDVAHRRWAAKKGLLEKILPILLVAIFALAIVLVLYGFSNYGTNIVQESAMKAAQMWDNVASSAAKAGQSLSNSPPPILVEPPVK